METFTIEQRIKVIQTEAVVMAGINIEDIESVLAQGRNIPSGVRLNEHIFQVAKASCRTCLIHSISTPLIRPKIEHNHV